MTNRRHLSEIRLKQYPRLNDFTQGGLRPLSIMHGPNGSGKSRIASSLKWLQQLTEYGCREAMHAIEASALSEIRMAVETVDTEGRRHCYEVGTTPSGGPKGSIAYEYVTTGPELETTLLEMNKGNGFAVRDGVPGNTKAEPVELAGTSDPALRILGNLTEYRTLADLSKWIAHWQVWTENRSLYQSGIPDVRSHTNAGGQNLAQALERLHDRGRDAYDKMVRTLGDICAIENLKITLRQDNMGVTEAMASCNAHGPTSSHRMGRGFHKALVTLMLIEQTPDGGLLLLDDADTDLDSTAAPRLADVLLKASERMQIIGTTSRPETFEAVSAYRHDLRQG